MRMKGIPVASAQSVFALARGQRSESEVSKKQKLMTSNFIAEHKATFCSSVILKGGKIFQPYSGLSPPLTINVGQTPELTKRATTLPSRI
mgnify:FL=1